METKVLIADWHSVRKAAKLIRAGELVAFPTETVYGLGADGFNPEARQKIYYAKNRANDLPLTLLVNSMEQIDNIAVISSMAEKILIHFFPGPLTAILPKRDIVPDFAAGPNNTIGVRIPDSELVWDLIRLSGAYLAAPSANLSGQSPPKTAREVLQSLGGRIPLILNGGECRYGVASTIVDLTDAEPKILRPGTITEEDIENALSGIR